MSNLKQKQKTHTFIMYAPKYQMENRTSILFCKNNYLKENSSSYFILLLKARGETCAREIHHRRLCQGLP